MEKIISSNEAVREVIEKQLEIDIPLVNKAINEAKVAGKVECFCYNISYATIKALKKYGYQVKVEKAGNCSTKVMISWERKYKSFIKTNCFKKIINEDIPTIAPIAN